MTGSPALILLGLLAAVLAALGVGAGLLGRQLRGPGGLALALALGLQAAVLLLLVLGPLGLPWTPLTVGVLGTVGLAGAVAARRGGGAEPAVLRHDEPGGAWAWAARLVLAAALALFLWKLAAAPLWSWDHYAMWGVKARRMVADGQLDLQFLSLPTLIYSRPGLPLGLPALWRFLALGAEPGVLLFKAAHALLALGLAAVVRAAVRQAGAPAAAADTLAALLAVSPLFWDTVGLGLADLPLAFWAASGLLLGLRALASPPDGAGAASPWLRCGFVLGFLPWIKEDGWPLCALLAAALGLLGLRRGAGALAGNARRILCLAAPVLALCLLARLYAARLLPAGYSFFDGDWTARGTSRLARAPEVAGRLLAHLADPAWIGCWLLFGAGLVAAALLRRRTALLLFAVVAGQLAVYVAVLLVAGPDPLDHLKASALRFSSVLLPIGLTALGALFAPAPAERTEAGGGSGS